MPLTLPIRDVLPATARARIVKLDLLGQPFEFLAGQAIFVGAHNHEKRRPYSIACAPEDVIREGCLELLIGLSADGTPGPHLQLDPGARVDIDGPVGRFTFPAAPDEQRFLFIAGGTGIAPLRAMLRHALAIPHRQVGVLYSARTPGDFAYEAELQALARDGRIRLRQTVTRDLTSEGWTGTRGRIGPQDLAPLVEDTATLCFICGPQALVDEMPRLVEALGVPRTRIRIEEW